MPVDLVGTSSIAQRNHAVRSPRLELVYRGLGALWARVTRAWAPRNMGRERVAPRNMGKERVSS